jgi:hypothetical protein
MDTNDISVTDINIGFISCLLMVTNDMESTSIDID